MRFRAALHGVDLPQTYMSADEAPEGVQPGKALALRNAWHRAKQLRERHRARRRA